jgi:DNA-binding CsgD family transcriptional regulator
MTAKSANQIARQSEPQDDPSLLTPRQSEILALLRAGKANKAIAHELGIGLGTVKQHLVALFKKLNVTNRAMAVSRSIGLDQPQQPEEPKNRWGSGGVNSIMELRPVCILSLAIKPASDESEESASLSWQLLQQAVTSTTASYECTVIGRPGVGLDVIFGLNRASDEDPLRALEIARAVYAVLTVKTSMGEQPEINIHAGLASGYLLASMMPRGGWTGETVAGRVIGRARELRDTSPAGFMLADPASLELIVFAQRAIRKPEIPGGTRISLSSRIRHQSHRPAPPAQPVIGREAEIGTISRHVQSLGEGNGGLVWIEGEAGMGKTTLCRSAELLCEQKGILFSEFRCGKGRANGQIAVDRTQRPLLVVIDDAHLATDEQAREIVSLAKLTETEPLLLLCAGRSARHPELQNLGVSSPVRLGRLPQAAMERLVDEKGGAALSPQTTAQVIELCQGVPLFAVELVRSLSARLGRPEAGFPLPLTLVMLVASRLDSVQVDRRLLHQLPALTPFNPRVIGDIRLGPSGQLTKEIERAINVGLLVRQGENIDFAHPLVKEVIRTLSSAAPLDYQGAEPDEAAQVAALKEKNASLLKQLRAKNKP